MGAVENGIYAPDRNPHIRPLSNLTLLTNCLRNQEPVQLAGNWQPGKWEMVFAHPDIWKPI